MPGISNMEVSNFHFVWKNFPDQKQEIHVSIKFWAFKEVTIGGSRGARPARAPLRVPILSFWHKKILKRNCLVSPHPLLRGPRPPLREILDPPLVTMHELMIHVPF